MLEENGEEEEAEDDECLEEPNSAKEPSAFKRPAVATATKSRPAPKTPKPEQEVPYDFLRDSYLQSHGRFYLWKQDDCCRYVASCVSA